MPLSTACLYFVSSHISQNNRRLFASTEYKCLLQKVSDPLKHKVHGSAVRLQHFSIRLAMLPISQVGGGSASSFLPEATPLYYLFPLSPSFVSYQLPWPIEP